MIDGTDRTHAPRISTLQRTVEQRLTNPCLRWLLQSRLHWLASRWLLLVSYEGRRSGRRYTFPVVYLRRDDSLVVVTPKRESSWWKHFSPSRGCTVWLEGDEFDATGEVVSDGERAVLLADYVETYGVVGRLLGVDAGAEFTPDQYEDIAVVRFRSDRGRIPFAQ